ncbi:MAG: IS630 transposase-related protein [Candidatus Competibacter sp.]
MPASVSSLFLPSKVTSSYVTLGRPNSGGTSEAGRRFEVSLWCVRNWLAREDLQPRQRGVPRRRKLDKAALRAHVRAYPEALLRERAAHFGVCYNAVWRALKTLKITPKKRR